MQGNVISLASRRAVLPGAFQELERQDAMTRLRGLVVAGTIVYVVLRSRSPRNDSLVCDLYLIDGHRVTCVTEEIGRVLDCFDPREEIGVRFLQARGRDPLRDLIDGSLSRLLFGERDLVRHQMIR